MFVTPHTATCTHGVTVVLLWCYYGVTMVLLWCYYGVNVVLLWCRYGDFGGSSASVRNTPHEDLRAGVKAAERKAEFRASLSAYTSAEGRADVTGEPTSGVIWAAT